MGIASEDTSAAAIAAAGAAKGATRPRRIHNPFPRSPPGLHFVRGHLHNETSAAFTSRTLAAGKHFLVNWDSTHQSLTVRHRLHPERALWSSSHEGSFLAAALGDSIVHESHGSFSLHDHPALLLSHQTVETIEASTPADAQRAGADSRSVSFGNGGVDYCVEDLSEARDPDGMALDDGHEPAVVVAGCLYSSCELAERELWRFRNGRRCESGDSPFYDPGEEQEDGETGVGVRYRLVFSPRREHQLGFHVELDAPVRKNGPSILSTSSRSSVKTSTRRSLSHRWKGRQREWREVRRVKPVNVDTNSEEFNVVVPVPRMNRVMLSYRSHAGERFFGFGEQFSYFDMKGRRVPILVQEQGLGRGDQPITAAANLVASRAGGDWHSTYAPSPHYLTSDMNSLYLEGYEHAVFDLTQPDCVQVQVHAGGMQGRILYGRTPRELIKEYTAAVGRMRALPAWITKGAIVGMQGGHDAVREVWRKVREYDVPLSAFWLQDWVGQRKTSVGWQLWWNWEVDRTHYPNWESLITDMSLHGVKTMAYLNPFIVARQRSQLEQRKELFSEAVEQGYAVADSGGKPYMLPITSFDAAMLDLTNPATREWFKRLMWGMVRSGVRGWMADFGESLPFDSCLHSGEDPATAHNRYPELWAELNREFVEEWEQEQRATKERDPQHRLDSKQQSARHPHFRLKADNSPENSPVDSTENSPVNSAVDLREDSREGSRVDWSEDSSEDLSEDSSEDLSEDSSEDLSENSPEDLSEDSREDLNANVSEDLNVNLPEDEDDGDDELVFFMRAGYRGSPRWATLFWEGDQMVSWQRNDGIKSAVTGLLSSGVSGFAFNHSDIGGYCTVDLPLLRYRRSEELLLRWMELNAFSVVFRSHEGNVPSANAQLYSNDTTLRHFARCAKIYRAWEFYRRLLVKEAAAEGMPVVRHLFLHYPKDEYVQTIVYQEFLVGSEILVVPVLDKGHTQVQAYFPAGHEWEHVWTGECFQAPTKQGLRSSVQAPLGFPAVFVKTGSWIGQQFVRNLVKEKLTPI